MLPQPPIAARLRVIQVTMRKKFVMDQQLNLRLDQNIPAADAGFRESALKSLNMTPHFKGTTSVFFTADRMFSGAPERHAQNSKPFALNSPDLCTVLKTTIRNGKDL